MKKRLIHAGREVYKASIVEGVLKVVYYGKISGETIHSPAHAYEKLTRPKNRTSYAYIPYCETSLDQLRLLFKGECQVQSRPAAKIPPYVAKVRRKKQWLHITT